MEEHERIDEIEREATQRQVYSSSENSFNMSKRNVTDCSYNSHVTLPEPLSSKEEAFISIRRSEWNKIFSKYREDKTRKDKIK